MLKVSLSSVEYLGILQHICFILITLCFGFGTVTLKIRICSAATWQEKKDCSVMAKMLKRIILDNIVMMRI